MINAVMISLDTLVRAFLLFLILIFSIYLFFFLLNLNKKNKMHSVIIECNPKIIKVQNILKKENELYHFSDNTIFISGYYDTNFKISLRKYLDYYDMLADKRTKDYFDNLFYQLNISEKDVDFILNLIEKMTDRVY